MRKTNKEPNQDKSSTKFLKVRDRLACTVTIKCGLEKKAAAMQPEIEKMEKKLLRLESQFHGRIPGEFIVTFVKGIYKALQYYLYLAYLRTCDFVNLQNMEQDIFKQLAKEQEQVEESKKVSEQLIQDCLDARILELRGAQAWKIHQAENAYLLTDPISTIVFKTIEKEYVMDPDPKVELLNILKSAPSFYHEHFIVGKSPPEESSVIEALEEYSRFHSKYVKAPIAAEPAVEKHEVENSGMADTTHR